MRWRAMKINKLATVLSVLRQGGGGKRAKTTFFFLFFNDKVQGETYHVQKPHDE